jgi:hypothetical protein
VRFGFSQVASAERTATVSARRPAIRFELSNSAKADVPAMAARTTLRWARVVKAGQAVCNRCGGRSRRPTPRPSATERELRASGR